MANQASKLLARTLGVCRDAEIDEEIYTEVNLARPEEQKFRSGLGLRVNINGRLGYAWSEGEISEDDLLNLAVENTLSGPSGSFSQKGFIPLPYTSTREEMNRQLEGSINRMQSFIQELDFMLPSILPKRRFSISARILQHTMRLTIRAGQRAANRILHFISLKSRDDIPVGASLYSTSFNHSPSELLCLLTWRSKLSEEIAWPENYVLPVVFSHYACGSLLEDFAADMLSIDSTCPPEALQGLQWLSPDISISDNGTIPGGFGTIPFDGEGLNKIPVTIIDRGKLSSRFYDLSAAKLNNLPPSCLAVRPWGAPPHPGYSNLCLKAGQYSVGDLCKKVGYGIFLDCLTPLSPNLKHKGEFARRCETAFILKNGRPVCRIPQFVVRGRYEDMLGKDLIGLGHNQLLHGRTLTVPLATKNLKFEETTIDSTENWSDYPQLWW